MQARRERFAGPVGLPPQHSHAVHGRDGALRAVESALAIRSSTGAFPTPAASLNTDTDSWNRYANESCSLRSHVVSA